MTNMNQQYTPASDPSAQQPNQMPNAQYAQAPLPQGYANDSKPKKEGLTGKAIAIIAAVALVCGVAGGIGGGLIYYATIGSSSSEQVSEQAGMPGGDMQQGGGIQGGMQGGMQGGGAQGGGAQGGGNMQAPDGTAGGTSGGTSGGQAPDAPGGNGNNSGDANANSSSSNQQAS